MSRRAAAGSRRRAELRPRLPRVGRLENLAAAAAAAGGGFGLLRAGAAGSKNLALGARAHFVERRLARLGPAGRLDLVAGGDAHLVESGFVDAGGGIDARRVVAAAF